MGTPDKSFIRLAQTCLKAPKGRERLRTALSVKFSMLFVIHVCLRSETGRRYVSFVGIRIMAGAGWIG